MLCVDNKAIYWQFIWSLMPCYLLCGYKGLGIKYPGDQVNLVNNGKRGCVFIYILSLAIHFGDTVSIFDMK